MPPRIEPGTVLRVPDLGVTVEVRATSDSTGGAYTEFDVSGRPRGGIALPHVHGEQTERHEVLEGTMRLAIGAQEHPYAYFSLPKKPVRTPKDLVGKKVGIQATAKVLLNALMKKHDIAEKDVEIVIIGSEMTPILTGQTDVVSGWITNTTTLKPLGPDRIDLRLWDTGVRLYALPYYATKDTIEKKTDMLAAYTRAASRGWEYALKNPEKAVDFLVKEYPNLKRDDEIEGSKALLGFAFNANTQANGWGAFDPAIWQEQIALYDDLKQFSAGAPKLEDVITTKILDATKAQRAKVG